jgi:predicted DNA-binding transcriptional regulator AlpA
MPPILTQRQAAALLTLSVRTLERLRLVGTGPKFVRLSRGRIAYREEDLAAWVAARVVGSTSEKENRNGR